MDVGREDNSQIPSKKINKDTMPDYAKPTLCIDLGASYTKLSLRRGCSFSRLGEIKRKASVLTIDNSPLIPSLAIKTDRSYEFGMRAAGMKPGGNMDVFVNWKADLFSTWPEKNTKATIITYEFFKWLKNKITELEFFSLDDVQTRIAIPAFKRSLTTANRIACCMEEVGWNKNNILRATEPHANAVGLLTGGLNCINKGTSGLFKLWENVPRNKMVAKCA